jgi:hypothetical protein
MQPAKTRFVSIQFTPSSAKFSAPFDDCCMHACLFISPSPRSILAILLSKSMSIRTVALSDLVIFAHLPPCSLSYRVLLFIQGCSLPG